MHSNIGIITQARMNSTRLPGKVLKEVNGLSLLQYHINRLKTSGIPIYIATSNHTVDDVIESFALKNNIPVYRGSELDVLDRFYNCAKRFSLTTIVRVTSDCPLIDGSIVKQGVEDYLKFSDKTIYYSNTIERTFARGFDFEVFSDYLLNKAFENANTDAQREHVTPYFYQKISSEVQIKHFLDPVNNGAIRVTVDTLEDFDLVKVLIENFKADTLSYNEIITVFKENPDLIRINAGVEQKNI
jgi:spore coat polysaccharide biosynthesis protein SpsF